MATITWINGVGGDFDTASNWSTGTVPGPGDDATINAGSTFRHVTSTSDETVNSLIVGAILSITDGVFTITNGAGTGVTGRIFVGGFTTPALVVSGVVNNASTLNFSPPGHIAIGNSYDPDEFNPPGLLEIDGNVTLSGGGYVSVSYSGRIISNGASATLTNDSDIFGAGTIGDAHLTLINDTSGVIEASGQGLTLVINTGNNVITNAGTFAADGFQSTLSIQSAIVNSGTIETGNTNGNFGAKNELDIFGPLTNSGIIDATGLDNVLNIRNITTNSGIIEAFGRNELNISGALLNSGTIKSIGIGSVLNIQYTVASSAMIKAIDGGTLNISGALTNLGTIEANNGTVDIAATVVGSGSLTIANHGTMILGTPCAEDVTFWGTGNTLILAQPWNFTGHLVGLAVGDIIDLALTTVASAAISGSTLVVTKAGGQTLTYQLASPSPYIHFVIQSDHAGGSNLIVTAGLPDLNPGDFNGDGKADLLWQNDNGQAAIWFMDGTTELGGANLRNNGPTWHAAAAADFNGDGKADVLWQNDNGQAAIWFMDGTTELGGANLRNNGPTWHAAAAADYNGDGKADILWQNDDGQPAIWFMDGTTELRGANLRDSGSDWHLI